MNGSLAATFLELVMIRFCFWTFWTTIAFILLFCILPLPLLAQGCSMCKTAAAAQSAQAAKSLNQAIIVLLTPPVTIMSGILVFAFRCRNSSSQPNELNSPDQQISARSI